MYCQRPIEVAQEHQHHDVVTLLQQHMQVLFFFPIRLLFSICYFLGYTLRRTRAHTCKHTYAHAHTRTHARAHTYACICIHTRLHMDVFKNLLAHHTHTNTHTHTHTHTHTRAHTHTHGHTASAKGAGQDKGIAHTPQACRVSKNGLSPGPPRHKYSGANSSGGTRSAAADPPPNSGRNSCNMERNRRTQCCNSRNNGSNAWH